MGKKTSKEESAFENAKLDNFFHYDHTPIEEEHKANKLRTNFKSQHRIPCLFQNIEPCSHAQNDLRAQSPGSTSLGSDRATSDTIKSNRLIPKHIGHKLSNIFRIKNQDHRVIDYRHMEHNMHTIFSRARIRLCIVSPVPVV